jgi:hypothetical protein
VLVRGLATIPSSPWSTTAVLGEPPAPYRRGTPRALRSLSTTCGPTPSRRAIVLVFSPASVASELVVEDASGELLDVSDVMEPDGGREQALLIVEILQAG